jgi:hypothetical protein
MLALSPDARAAFEQPVVYSDALEAWSLGAAGREVRPMAAVVAADVVIHPIAPGLRLSASLLGQMLKAAGAKSVTIDLGDTPLGTMPLSSKGEIHVRPGF